MRLASLLSVAVPAALAGCTVEAELFGVDVVVVQDVTSSFSAELETAKLADAELSA